MTASERLATEGYEGVIVFDNFSYDDALIGVSHDNRAVYDYGLMVEWLVKNEGMSPEEAAEWIDYNTLRALDYAGEMAPIVVYSL